MAASTYGSAGDFSTTRWSQVLLAGQLDDSKNPAALEHLCAAYWYPLYHFARRRGLSPEDSQDLVQSFFYHFLEKNYIARADRELGRFRSFLLTSFKNFMANERARAQAVKRGGHIKFLSQEALQAEGRYAMEPAATTDSPDQAFERSWAISTMEQALTRLQNEYQETGNGLLYDALKSQLWADEGTETYAQLAARLQTTEASVKMAVLRLRRRCREALRAEVARTVNEDAEIDEEIRHLMATLRR